MKKFIRVGVCLMLVMSLCSCSNYARYIKKSKEAQAKAEAEASKLADEYNKDYEVENTMATEGYSDETTVADEKPDVDIDFRTFTYKYEDAQGYKYEATIMLSPWIIESDEVNSDAAWMVVSEGFDINKPTSSSMSLQRYTDNLYMGETSSTVGSSLTDKFYATMTDMYFTYGTISIKNITPGWDFSEEKPGNGRLSLGWGSDSLVGSYGSQYAGVGKVYYRGSENTNMGHVYVNPSMKSNSWGPVPFVFGHADNITPNYPDGQYRQEIVDGYLMGLGNWDGEWNKTLFRIPLIGESWEDVGNAANESPVVEVPVETVETVEVVESVEPVESAAPVETAVTDETMYSEPQNYLYDLELSSLAKCLYWTTPDMAKELANEYFGRDLGEYTCDKTEDFYYEDTIFEWGDRYVYNVELAEKIDILGIDFNRLGFDANRRGDEELIYTVSLVADQYAIGDELEADFNSIYDHLVARYGEPSEAYVDDPEYTYCTHGGMYYWYNTEIGTIWLDWGTDMWGSDGLNAMYLAATVPNYLLE